MESAPNADDGCCVASEMTSEQAGVAAPARDALVDKANRFFRGKVVRKDLMRKVKVGSNVQVLVLEFLLGK